MILDRWCQEACINYKVSDDKIHETSHGKLFIGTFEQNTKFIRNVTHLEKVMNIDVR